MSRFQPATKRKARARIALVGPSGSGKTYTALVLASGLGERVAVIDTERGSASKYADVAKFDTLDLDVHSPQTYVQAIADAASEGYDVLVIDSLSHAWNGREGALEQVDKAASRSRSGNSFTAWRDITPLHNQLVDAILRFPGHVIVTMRATTAYELQEGANGKKTPTKIGMKPIQRDGIEYEFDIVADMDHTLTLTVSKTRCPALYDVQVQRPTVRLAQVIRGWLDDGAEMLQSKPIETNDPRPMSTPLRETMGTEERERAALQQAMKDGVIAASKGMVDQFMSFTHVDEVTSWGPTIIGRFDELPAKVRDRAYAAMRTHAASGLVTGMDEAGFVELWDHYTATIARRGE